MARRRAGHAEPTILVDRLGRSILVGDHFGVSRSADGGQTWRRTTPPYIYATTTDGAANNVARSSNGGLSWDLGASTFVVEAGVIADRPWLAARNTGEVAVVWNEGGLWQPCAYSTDSALAFATHSPPAFSAPRPISADSPPSMARAASSSRGTAASAALRRGSTATPPGRASPRWARSSSRPWRQLSTHVVADSGGIYLATPTADNEQMTLLGLNGFTLTGSKRLAVSPSSLAGNTFGTIAARGDGEIAVVWYSTTWPGNFQDPNFNGHWNVTAARVKDFWTPAPTIVFQQVTTASHHIGDLCMLGTSCDINGDGDRDLLDYFQATYDAAGNLHIAYATDGAGSRASVYYAKLAALS